MKKLFVLFMLFILSVNSFATASECYMEHNATPIENSEAMPCHDSIEESGVDICDCDNCVQFLYSFYSITFSVNPIEAASFNRVQYNSLDSALNYRPPIKSFI